jgi:hypothetical protein
LVRFVDRILISLDAALADALAEENLTMAEMRLLMAIDRRDASAAEILAHVDPGEDPERRLRGLGLLESSPRKGQHPQTTRLSASARAVLLRFDRAAKATLTELFAGLDGSERLRLQGAMHLVSDRFDDGGSVLSA